MNVAVLARDPRPEDLLLREAHHRCSNDLQLIVSLLQLQARRTTSKEARLALGDAADRVAILARNRSARRSGDRTDLADALRQVCEALRSQAQPRGIVVTLRVMSEVPSLSCESVATLALIVNELAVNAIKHAFAEDVEGSVTITVRQHDTHLAILVDDDGLPFPELDNRDGDGLGLSLVRRLMDSLGGLIILPSGGDKIFEIRVPTAPEVLRTRMGRPA